VRPLFATLLASLCPLFSWAQTGAIRSNTTTITFVANPENQTTPRVRYSGNVWTADQGGFLVGTGRGHRLLAEVPPGVGDFRVEIALALSRAGSESSIVLGADSALTLASGAKQWKLSGRFFRAGETAIEFAAPQRKPGQSFNLAITRNAETVTIAVDGVPIHRNPCSGAALSALGIDPGTGLVHLYSFSADGRFPKTVTPAKPFGNPFGMQLRHTPIDAKAIWEPVIARGASTNENSIICRRDGTLEIYSVTKPESNSTSVVRSADGGITWSEPKVVFPLPGRAYSSIQTLEAADGSLHAVVHVGGEGPGGYRGRLYEVYYTSRLAKASEWSLPRRIVPGYIGAIRGFIQLQRSGRLLLAVARAIPEREQAPQSGPDYGWNDTFVYFSDNHGATWRQSPDQLSIELKTPNVTRYGAIEPVVLELRDGRVWMLVRDRGGRLWQSFSTDGERWPALERSPFISSDSPAALLRLRNGKIVLLTNACQNWTNPRSYAMGGREVLHAAISADDGKTWRGFREIFDETDIVSGGDRGTAYPSAVENGDGKVVVVSGQGEGKRAIVAFDPRWLDESEVRDDLTTGPTGWTQYGDEGLHVETVDGGVRVIAIPLKSSGLCGAVWNFPAADTGELKLRLQIPPRANAVRLCLNDHFNRIDDKNAAQHAVFSVDWGKVMTDAAAHWHNVTLRWSDAQKSGKLTVEIDGKPKVEIPSQRSAQFGLNYLRVEFRATSDEGRVLLASASMCIRP
jgi:hypothetical protein